MEYKTIVVFAEDLDKAKVLRLKVTNNGGYCPNAEIRCKDTKCMCKEFRQMTEGVCKCGLYKKVKVLK